MTKLLAKQLTNNLPPNNYKTKLINDIPPNNCLTMSISNLPPDTKAHK